MARNRKYRSAAIRFGPALKAVLLCLLIGGAGVGYVWQKDQISRLGKQILLRERQVAELHEHNERLARQLGMMHSPAYLERRIRELNLGLVPPQPSQVFRLREPGPERPAAAERQYAAQNK
jgi:hypothetical protein